jgi:signal peptidase II
LSLQNKKYLSLLVPIVFVLIIDQLTKYWVRTSPELHRWEIIEGWFAFTYTQNPGMAMGMSWLSTPAISIIAILATIGIFIYLFKTMDQANIPYLLCMGFILGGALGNITDRLVMGIIEGYGGVLHGHVVDFLHFTLVIGDRPVFPYIFNFADVAISTSIIVLLLFGKWILPDEAVAKKEIEQPEIAEEMMGEKNTEPGETA